VYEGQRVDWSLPAIEVDRLIRGLSPFPGAWCMADGARVKLLGSRVVEGSGAPGAILDGFRIACGPGAVEVTRAQREGKMAMEQDVFLAGAALPNRLD